MTAEFDDAPKLANLPNLALKRILPQESLSRQIASQLESAIGDGQLAPGARLPTETRLCEMFGVSRTVVREAMALLRSQGLVETQRGVGTRVAARHGKGGLPVHHIRATTVADILLVLELRLSLEPRAAALAAQRHTAADASALRSTHAAFVAAVRNGDQAREEDYRFHRQIAEATHNPCFPAIYAPMNQGAIPRAKLLAAEMDDAAVGDYLDLIESEHAAVLEAILAGDALAAQTAMQRHLDRPYQMYAALAAAQDAAPRDAAT